MIGAESTHPTKFLSPPAATDRTIGRKILFSVCELVLACGFSVVLWYLPGSVVVRCVAVAAFLIGWLCFSAIGALVLSSFLQMALDATGLVFVLAPVFHRLNLQVWFVAWAILWLLKLSVASRIRNVMRDSVSCSRAILGASVRHGQVLVAAVVLSLLVGASLLTNGFSFSQKDVTALFTASEPLVRIVIPSVSATTTLEQIFQANIAASARDIQQSVTGKLPANLPGNLAGVGAALSASVEQSARIEFFDRLSTVLKRPVSPTETIPETIYLSLRRLYDQLSQGTQRSFGAIAFAMLFISIWSFVALFNVMFLIVFWIWFEVLVALGVIRMKTITVEKRSVSF